MSWRMDCSTISHENIPRNRHGRPSESFSKSLSVCQESETVPLEGLEEHCLLRAPSDVEFRQILFEVGPFIDNNWW